LIRDRFGYRRNTGSFSSEDLYLVPLDSSGLARFDEARIDGLHGSRLFDLADDGSFVALEPPAEAERKLLPVLVASRSSAEWLARDDTFSTFKVLYRLPRFTIAQDGRSVVGLFHRTDQSFEERTPDVFLFE
jgi:hypothetical protein